MIKIFTIIKSYEGRTDTTLTLDYAKRQKCTQRVRLDNGDDAGLMLARGIILCDGDVLEAENGLKVKVCAAEEGLSLVTCQDPILFAKACYHLGNRHAPAQIEEQTLLYQHDHVLDDMLRGLGLTVKSHVAPFFPENGAYHSHGGGHSH